MKKHDIDQALKIGLLALSVALTSVCIYEIITTESSIGKIICAVGIAVILAVDGYLLFFTKGIHMDESNKVYRDKVYLKNKPSFISSGEKFLDVAAIDDIVSKASSVFDNANVPEQETCPICGKKIVRDKTVMFYFTHTIDKSEDKYWGDEFGNYVRPAYEENQHTNRNDDAVQIKCTACGFGMMVGWIKKSQKDYDGNYMQMTTRSARIYGVKLCQASRSKLAKELKIANNIELAP